MLLKKWLRFCIQFHLARQFTRLVALLYLAGTQSELWDSEPGLLAQLTLEASVVCEMLGSYIFMCVLSVMFYLVLLWCMSSPGVLKDSVEAVSNNSYWQWSCVLLGEITLHAITPQIAD